MQVKVETIQEAAKIVDDILDVVAADVAGNPIEAALVRGFRHIVDARLASIATRLAAKHAAPVTVTVPLVEAAPATPVQAPAPSSSSCIASSPRAV